MVLFLFVIMLLNLGRPGPTDLKGPAGLGVGVLLAGLLLVQLLGLRRVAPPPGMALAPGAVARAAAEQGMRSEEHTSELQSRLHLVCRLLLEKKKKKKERVVDCSQPGGGRLQAT